MDPILFVRAAWRHVVFTSGLLLVIVSGLALLGAVALSGWMPAVGFLLTFILGMYLIHRALFRRGRF